MVSLELFALVLTGLSITASITYYSSVLSNANKTQQHQLETRQAQLFMQLVNRFRDDTKDLDINKSLLYVEIDSFDEFMRMYENETCFQKSIQALGGFYESVGIMVREGYIPIRLVALMWAGVTRRFWEKLQPYFSELRELRGFPRAWAETEYLYHELMRYIEEHPELAT